MVSDAWEITPDHHEVEIICCKCGRSTHFDISRREYRMMDNRKPWTMEQEGNRG